MHNLAITLKQLGYDVSGSDDKIYDPSRSRLEKYNLLPKDLGWFPELIDKEIDFIVLGMHAKKDNPELLKALDLDCKIYSYPELIFEFSKSKTPINAHICFAADKFDKLWSPKTFNGTSPSLVFT